MEWNRISDISACVGECDAYTRGNSLPNGTNIHNNANGATAIISNDSANVPQRTERRSNRIKRIPEKLKDYMSKHGKRVEWTSKDLLKGLEEFVPIYETRPIKDNIYGMGFDYGFGLWFIARRLKPDLMIESGAFKGHSTWVLRQAMPDTPIISLSPRYPEKYLKKGPAYVDGNCTCFAGKEFVEFGSMDWGRVSNKHGITDCRGGHSCFRVSDEARIRMKRKKLWEKAVDVLYGPGEEWWGVRGEMRDDFNHTNKPITYSEHFQNRRFVESVLDVYWELPPVAGPSLTHQSPYDPATTQSPLVEDGRYGLFQRLGSARFDKSVFSGHTQMVYLPISSTES